MPEPMQMHHACMVHRLAVQQFSVHGTQAAPTLSSVFSSASSMASRMAPSCASAQQDMHAHAIDC